MLRFYSPVCELEAMNKCSTDIFSLAEHSDWAFQSFTLRQAICDIFQIIWMDVQRTCMDYLHWASWRTSVLKYYGSVISGYVYFQCAVII